jgi:hypothetical protein
MYLTEVILGLRELGIGRSLSASEIVYEIDKHLFPSEMFFDDDGNEETKLDQLERKIFRPRINEWLNVPVVPRNQTMIVDEKRFNTSAEWVDFFEEMYESKSWCKGFDLIFENENGVEDLTQLDAIKSFLRASEIVKYLLSGEGWDADDKDCVLAARCAVSKFSENFRMAGEYFKSALFPSEIETQSLEIWADEDSYKFSDADCENLAKRFCEVVMALNGENGAFYDWDATNFFLPTDLAEWQESKDFLLEINVLENPTWKELAFCRENVFEIALNRPKLAEPLDRWIRNFNEEYSPSKWVYYFWEQPFDAAVWADCAFSPAEAALWSKIGYDAPDALDDFYWNFSTIAPMVHAGMAVTAESVKLWGNARASSEILRAVDKGFPNIKRYQEYESIDSDFSTISRFLAQSKHVFTTDELSRAITLEQHGMNTTDSIEWSVVNDKFSAVIEFKTAQQTPLQASKWIENGIQLDAAIEWVSQGHSLQDALLWRKHKIDFDVALWFLRLKIDNPREAKTWLRYFSRTQIENATERGFRDINDYKKYRDIESDFSTIQRIINFSKRHLNQQELSRAIALEQSGLDTEDAVAWSKLDQPLSAVLEFKSAQQTPLQASKWIKCGIPISTALEWVSLGVSQKDALIWIEHDVDFNLAQWFLEHRIVSPREGKLWLKYIPRKDIPNWKAAEFDPISASDWREIGFGPKTSLEWIAQGVNSAKEAGEWLENKFELKEAIQWLARSISPENAKKWRDKGVGPDIAQRREQAGIKP